VTGADHPGAERTGGKFTDEITVAAGELSPGGRAGFRPVCSPRSQGCVTARDQVAAQHFVGVGEGVVAHHLVINAQ
jgi:hypothetical protein